MVPSAALVSKDAISKVGYFDERLSGYEDDDLFVRLFWAGYRAYLFQNRGFALASLWEVPPLSARGVYGWDKQAKTILHAVF